MLDTFKRVWDNIYLRVLFLAGSFYLVFFLLSATRIAWGSFLIAYLIAYLVEPFVLRLEKARLVARWLSVALTVLLILVLFVIGTLLVGDILLQLSELVAPSKLVPLLTRDFPDRLDAWEQAFLANLPERFNVFFGDEVPSLSTLFEQQRGDFSIWLRNRTGNLVNLAREAVTGVFGGLGRGLVIVTLAAFIISGYRKLQYGFYQLFPERHRPFIKELTIKLDKSVGGYVRAKALESIIIGFVVWIVLLILQVPKAAAIAFVAAILNPIPYIGPAIATIPATLSALTVGWVPALITFIVMAIIQGLDGNVLAPILLSQSISVNPVTVLVSVLAGGALLGFWGILLSIPFAAFVQLLYNDYYLKSDWYLGKTRLGQPPEDN